MKDWSTLIINDPDLIIRLSFDNSDLDTYCKNPVFFNYWEDILSRYDQKLAKEILDITLPDYTIKSIPTMHVFDQLKGIYMYIHYLAVRDNPLNYLYDIASEYLDKGSQLGCFQALVTNNFKHLNLYKSTNDYEHAKFALNYARQAAEKYWTAGYLFLASTYRELSHNDRYASIEAFKYILIAEKLEEYSKDMINNAFKGDSLYTRFQFKTWMEAKQLMISYLIPSMNAIEIQQSYQLANKTVNSIILRYHLQQENIIEESKRFRM